MDSTWPAILTSIWNASKMYYEQTALYVIAFTGAVGILTLWSIIYVILPPGGCFVSLLTHN